MGMDVCGRKATTEAGKYFRNNVWWWRPLWAYCREVAPVAHKVVNYGSNDGDGLNKADSLRLAAILREEMSLGRTKSYEEAYKAHLAALPREECEYCHGTGIRTDAVGIAYGWPAKVVDEPGNPRHGQLGSCNACNGWGTKQSFETNYPFSEENVREFAEFLEGCGGFKIY